MKQENICQKKKEMLTNNNGLVLFVKGAWKESKIDWIVSRTCTISGYKDFTIGTYNILCDIIHIKNKLH